MRGERGGTIPAGRAILLAGASSLLLALAFPTYGLEPLAWVALVPLLLALRARGPVGGALLGLLFGTAFAALACSWFTEAQGFGLPELGFFSIFIGCSFALFGLAFGLVSRRLPRLALAAAPAAWVAMEYLRVNVGLLGFPGLFLGHTQYRALAVIQVSALTGAYGVSFLVATVNAILAAVAARRMKGSGLRRRGGGALVAAAAATGVLVVACLGFGVVVLAGAEESPGEVTVTVVQANIPQDVRWDPEQRERHLEKHQEMTRRAARAARADLVAWAETTVQGSLRHDPVLGESMGGLAREIGTPLLVGSAERAKFRARDIAYPNRYNSAFLIGADGSIAGEYRKIRLFPFGEYLPYQGVLPWPTGWIRTSNYLAGKEHTLFDLDGTRFGTLICWESMFPGLFREFVRRGADFMLDITNEAWFGESQAPRYFLAINVFRAVEHRISLVRVSNAGISCFIGPQGQVLGRVEEGGRDIAVEGTLTRAVPLPARRTFYTRHGDLFAYLCLCSTGTVLLAAVAARRRREGSAS